jgi:4-diphosphocytidyl-2-C-methyl-D-erythritol kinase
MPEIVVTVAAKLTLALHITGTRADGYHELDATMISIEDPCDLLVIEPARRTSLTITGPFAAGVPADASNLAWRAADACGVGVRISLDKGIPSGAGLGGGSADAAGVLVALRADPAIAATLGADVPFCMQGGAAHVGGVGEELHSVELPGGWFVVATPRFACSTAEVYRAWDVLGGPRDPVNDLHAAAEHVEPRLREFKQRVEGAAGAPAFMAGSGSSFAVAFDQVEDADEARARLERTIDGSVWLTRPTPFGVIANRPGLEP